MRAIVILSLVSGLGLGCGFSSDATHPASPANVIFVLIDTLRADHVSSYGYERPTTPNLDRFLGRTALFLNSRSQAACTFPSVNSLLTSRHPMEFISRGTLPEDPGTEEVKAYWQTPRGPAVFGIPDDIKALPEILADAGFYTMAVSASSIVRNTKSTEATNRRGGFGRGFEVFDEHCLNEKADCVNKTAFELLRGRPAGRRFFAYLHYMDPHDPYGAPAGFEKRFSGSYSGKRYIAKGTPHPLKRLIDQDQLDRISEADIGHLVNLYDDGIAHFDHNFGKLIDFLETSQILDDTLLVILSDHGESFLNHSTIAHCNSVFDSEIRTPLAFYIPGAREGQRLTVAAQNLDIVPTVLDYLGVEAGELPLDGRTLRHVIDGRPPENDRKHDYLVFSAQRGWRSVNNQNHKLIYNLMSGDRLLFDLNADPDEQRNLAGEEPGLSRQLSDALSTHIVDTEGSDFPEDSLKQSRQVEDQLRALGYFE